MYEDIERSWTEDSADYDAIVKRQLADRRSVEYWTKELKGVLGEKKLRILDIGCGPGFITIILSRLGHDVKAVDGSVGMVEKASSNFCAEGLSVRAEQEDAVTLENEVDNSYDVLISRDVIWTLYDPEKAFRRWKQVLKPGGTLIYYDGAFRDYRTSPHLRAWKKLSAGLIFLTERKIYREDVDQPTGAFQDLPFFTAVRPGDDFRALKKSGFHHVQITWDAFRNSPFRMDFWKYGYLGKYFRVIASSPGRDRKN